jgi:hypothetical protein
MERITMPAVAVPRKTTRRRTAIICVGAAVAIVAIAIAAFAGGRSTRMSDQQVSAKVHTEVKQRDTAGKQALEAAVRRERDAGRAQIQKAQAVGLATDYVGHMALEHNIDEPGLSPAVDWSVALDRVRGDTSSGYVIPWNIRHDDGMSCDGRVTVSGGIAKVNGSVNCH